MNEADAQALGEAVGRRGGWRRQAPTLALGAGAAVPGLAVVLGVVRVLGGGELGDGTLTVASQASPILFSLVAGAGLLLGIALLLIVCCVAVKLLPHDAPAAALVSSEHLA